MLDEKTIEELESQLTRPIETIRNANRKSKSDKRFRLKQKKRRREVKLSRRRNRR